MITDSSWTNISILANHDSHHIASPHIRWSSPALGFHCLTNRQPGHDNRTCCTQLSVVRGSKSAVSCRRWSIKLFKFQSLSLASLSSWSSSSSSFKWPRSSIVFQLDSLTGPSGRCGQLRPAGKAGSYRQLISSSYRRPLQCCEAQKK